MRKSYFIIFIFVATAIAVSVWPSKAGAIMYRGVYVNGQVHYMSLGAASKQQTVTHQSGAADSNFNLSLGTAVTQTVNSCTPDCGQLIANAAVFDQKIFFAYTGNPGCTVNKNGFPPSTHLFVVAWDLTTGDFVRTNGANSAYAGPVDLGAVYRTDANAVANYVAVQNVANTAIVVFNNLLYVFADNATFTSGDGVNWSSYPPRFRSAAITSNPWTPSLFILPMPIR